MSNRLPISSRLRFLALVIATSPATAAVGENDASGFALTSPGNASDVDTTTTDVPSLSDAPYANEAEAYLAKRPWLLEKLRGAARPSQKMTPPTPPPAPDPPSIQLGPQSVPKAPMKQRKDTTPITDGWVPRGKTQSIPVQRSPRQRTKVQDPAIGSPTQPQLWPPQTRSSQPMPSRLQPQPLRDPVPFAEVPPTNALNSGTATQSQPSASSNPSVIQDTSTSKRVSTPRTTQPENISNPNHPSKPNRLRDLERSLESIDEPNPSAIESSLPDLNEPAKILPPSVKLPPEGQLNTATTKKAKVTLDRRNSSKPSKSISGFLKLNPPALEVEKEHAEPQTRSIFESKKADIEKRLDDLKTAHDSTTSRNEISVKSDSVSNGSKAPEALIPPRRKLRSLDLDQFNTSAKALTPKSHSIGEEIPKLPKSVASVPEIERDYAGFPQRPFQLTTAVRRMEPTMKRCLQHYYQNYEHADKRSNWGMMHQIMVYGVDTQVIAGRRRYSTIAWIAGNNACRGQRLLTDGHHGIEVKSGVGLQGHQAQMLAVFALAGVPANYPLFVASRRYTMSDVIRLEQSDCKSGEELTFTLIGLSHYLDTDETWIGADGRTWDFERLIQEELSQPIVGAACGGTHRLMGFAHALRKRRAEGKPITGQWSRAEQFTEDFLDYTFQLQNRDGSMSTDWFEGRQNKDDMDRKVQTTGHIVEWILTSVPDSRLQDHRIVNAIRYLLSSMYSGRGHDWSIGPKGHALRSLALFYQRVYQNGPAWVTPQVAGRNNSPRR